MKGKNALHSIKEKLIKKKKINRILFQTYNIYHNKIYTKKRTIFRTELK